MISTEIKYLKSLYNRKTRVVEKKVILDGLRLIYESYRANAIIDTIFFTNSFYDRKKNDKYVKILLQAGIPTNIIKESELNKISNNSNPQGIISTCHISYKKIPLNHPYKSNWVILDNISDPGNLGTILRTCEWFGIKNILISNDSVDIYNDKVLRSAMGAHFYFENILQSELLPIINELKNNSYIIAGTSINGDSINTITLEKKINYAIVMGNEANGISKHLHSSIEKYIRVPQAGNIESLNVAIACGIILNKINC